MRIEFCYLQWIRWRWNCIFSVSNHDHQIAHLCCCINELCCKRNDPLYHSSFTWGGGESQCLCFSVFFLPIWVLCRIEMHLCTHLDGLQFMNFFLLLCLLVVTNKHIHIIYMQLLTLKKFPLTIIFLSVCCVILFLYLLCYSVFSPNDSEKLQEIRHTHTHKKIETEYKNFKQVQKNISTIQLMHVLYCILYYFVYFFGKENSEIFKLNITGEKNIIQCCFTSLLYEEWMIFCCCRYKKMK